jgi:hypothetical protein
MEVPEGPAMKTVKDLADKEVEALRHSAAFQRFLEQRSRSPRRFSLDDVEAEIDRELAGRPEQA